jgi:hypothetical protein
MRNRKDFGKGRAADGTSCKNCGIGIDTSRIDSSLESHGAMHHFDKDGDSVSSHFGHSDEFREAGTHCPECADAADKREEEDGRAEYNEMNNDYMRDT